MKAQQLWFVEPRKVLVKEVELSVLAEDEVLVRTACSGISAGTEMLAYRGLLPKDLPLDETITAMQDQASSYPLQYGYACVGSIEQQGAKIAENHVGQRVFAFNPHASIFKSRLEDLIFLPDEISDEAGIFLANMETAVNLLIDGKPGTEESVAIFGLGIVGQLLGALIEKEKMQHLYLIDGMESRRKHASSNSSPSKVLDIGEISKNLPEAGIELIYELSGNPEALNLAIDICSFAGRIIVGSWYGEKTAELKLGGKFHRNRLKIISSQVSTIDPEHQLEWTKKKRMQKALEELSFIKPQRFITHRFKLTDAEAAYRLLDEKPEKTLQLIFEYED